MIFQPQKSYYPTESRTVEIVRSDWQMVVDELSEIGADSLSEMIYDDLALYTAGTVDGPQAVTLTMREYWEMVGALSVHRGRINI